MVKYKLGFIQIHLLNIKTSLWNLLRKMDKKNILQPPDRVYGITKLDKKLFEKQINIPVLTVSEGQNPNIKVSAVLPSIKKYLLKLELLKPIITNDKGSFKVLLNPEVVKNWTDLSEETKESLKKLNLDEQNLITEDLLLKYENYSADAVLKAILPKEKEGMSSFTKIGHIVHVNLREHLLPYKEIVGEVLYDKIPNCKSVVNKVNMIDNTYRNFSMEVLKGTDDMLTTVKENNCQFCFDFSTVYWNSRLCTEHERIVKKIHPNDVLFDVFAGVGPFSIPCAKNKCTTFANDLNPESFKWLNHNKKLNKINDEHLKTYNLDGKDFILTVIKENLIRILKENSNKQVYITMNLPALAVEFLPNFVSLLNNTELPQSIDFKPPILFVYCFAKGEQVKEIAKDLVVNNFKKNDCDITEKITEIFSVRTVSSMKDMMRVTVKLDRDVLVGNREMREDIREKRQFVDKGDEGCNKKCRIDGKSIVNYVHKHITAVLITILVASAEANYFQMNLRNIMDKKRFLH